MLRAYGTAICRAVVLAALPLAAPAEQGDVPASPALEQIERLSAQIQQLQQQLEALSRQVAEAQTAARQAKASAATSEEQLRTVYRVPADPRSTCHLAGYRFANFVAPSSGSTSFTQTSFNPIFDALYDDRILFEGELEVVLGEAGGTEVRTAPRRSFRIMATDATSTGAQEQ